jgi:L,D-transpeptidase catalytic domain
LRTYTVLVGLLSLALTAFANHSPRITRTRPLLARTTVATVGVAAGAIAAPVTLDAPVTDAPVSDALKALSPLVVNKSDANALRMAFQAYFGYKSAHPEKVRNPYFYFVDYGLDSRTQRGYVFDMQRLKLIEGPFSVAHGRGSSGNRNGVPERFSNAPGSASTSLGLYLTQETYGFNGKSGGRHYSSLGLRMTGVSGRFNDNARARGVVVHGAPYVTASGAGRSEGCPAMGQARARRLIPLIANGGMVFHFSPNDARWLRGDPWAGASAGN